MRTLLSAVLVLVIGGATVGCTTMNSLNEPLAWGKPGGTYEEYMENRLTCIHESMMNYSAGAAVIGSYGGASRSNSTSCLNRGLFGTCMTMKGWATKKAGGFKPPKAAWVTGCPGT